MNPSRRAFLRAAGATLALPFLPSLVPRAHAATASPVRLLFFYVPNGVRMDRWRPTGQGTAWTPGPTLASLEDIREHVLVVSGLHNRAADGDRPGDHARGTASFLTGAPVAFDGVHAGVSADQVAARHLGLHTAFRSLELGVEPGGTSGVCDSGYSCAYTQNISWAGPQTPMPKMTRPRLVFDRLFAGGGSDEATAARRARHRGSVLDLVREQAAALQRRVAVEDRHRLDEYLAGVRELERRVEHVATACGPSEPPPGEVTLEDQADLLLDLAVAAFRCDATRVVTFMLGNAASQHVYRFLPGVTGAHHELSHHQGLTSHLDQLAVIDAWEVARFGRLVRRLAEIPEGDGTLLDHTVVVFGSEISDGDDHNHDDMPVLVAGRGGGAVAPGRHLTLPGEPFANLLLGVLQGAGVPVARLGVDGTRPLPGLAG